MSTDPHQPPAGPPGGTGATPQDAPAAGPTPPHAAPGLRFFNSVRELGIVRPDDGRLAAGVCVALARRFGVDPLLVRGVFVVLTVIGGFGVGLYGLLWLLLPHPDGRIHAEGVLHGVVTAGFVGGLILFLGDFASGLHRGGPPFWFATWGPPRGLIFWALVLLAVWFWATRGRRQASWPQASWPQPPGGPGYPQPFKGAPDAGPATTGAGQGAGDDPSSGPAGSGIAGSGMAGLGSTGSGMAGAPPFGSDPAGPPHAGPGYPAQDYPAQGYPAQGYPAQGYPQAGWSGGASPGSTAGTGTVTYRPTFAPAGAGSAPVVVSRLDLQKPSHPLTLAVLGLALVGAAAVVLWDHAIRPLPANAGLVAVAVALGIVALGVVLAGLLGRRAGGLAPIAVLLALVSILGALGHGTRSPFGPTTWRPLTPDTAQSGYSQGAGDVILDLTEPGLVTGRTPTTPVDIPVQLGVGRLRIVVPDGTAAEIDASVGAGNISDSVNANRTVSSGNGGGAGVKRDVRMHGDEPVIIVRANVGLGSVEIVPQGQAVTS